jgi:hypothetical protein
MDLVEIIQYLESFCNSLEIFLTRYQFYNDIKRFYLQWKSLCLICFGLLLGFLICSISFYLSDHHSILKDTKVCENPIFHFSFWYYFTTGIAILPAIYAYFQPVLDISNSYSIHSLQKGKSQNYSDGNYFNQFIIGWNVLQHDPLTGKKTLFLPTEETIHLSNVFNDAAELENLVKEHVQKQQQIYENKTPDKRSLELFEELASPGTNTPSYVIALPPLKPKPTDPVNPTDENEKRRLYRERYRDHEELHRHITNLISNSIRASDWKSFAHRWKNINNHSYPNALYLVTYEPNAPIKALRVWIMFPDELKLLRNSNDLEMKFRVPDDRPQWNLRLKNLHIWSKYEFDKDGKRRKNPDFQPVHTKEISLPIFSLPNIAITLEWNIFQHSTYYQMKGNSSNGRGGEAFTPQLSTKSSVGFLSPPTSSSNAAAIDIDNNTNRSDISPTISSSPVMVTPLKSTSIDQLPNLSTSPFSVSSSHSLSTIPTTIGHTSKVGVGGAGGGGAGRFLRIMEKQCTLDELLHNYDSLRTLLLNSINEILSKQAITTTTTTTTTTNMVPTTTTLNDPSFVDRIIHFSIENESENSLFHSIVSNFIMEKLSSSIWSTFAHQNKLKSSSYIEDISYICLFENPCPSSSISYSNPPRIEILLCFESELQAIYQNSIKLESFLPNFPDSQKRFEKLQKWANCLFNQQSSITMTHKVILPLLMDQR